MATSIMGGTAVNAQVVDNGTYGTCWLITLSGDDTVPEGCLVDMYGNCYATSTQAAPGSGTASGISADEAAMIAATTFGGYADSVVASTDPNYGSGYVVNVHDDMGNTGTYFVSSGGNPNFINQQ